MPTAPRKLCARASCSILVESGHSYCPAHRRTTDHGGQSARQRGYTRRWDLARESFRNTYPLCGDCVDGHPVMSTCHAQGRPVVATVVDHKIPHRGDMQLFWDVQNWQSLCDACHTNKTAAGL